jgi:predicted TIM-barrel fold metal-dependent hydrolase
MASSSLGIRGHILSRSGLERLDEHVKARDAQAVSPSEFARRGRLFFSCEPDVAGLGRVAESVGVDAILYASDYPHGDGKWPETVSAFRSIPGLNENARQKILGANATYFCSGLTKAQTEGLGPT